MTSTNDLRTRLLATHEFGKDAEEIRVSDFGKTFRNPDGPEAVAALDERDERIKALEDAGNKLLRVGDDKLATRSEWLEAVQGWRNLLTNPKGIRG